MTSKLALATVVQHCGLRRCPECISPDQRKCADAWLHKASGVCHYCEPLWEILSEHAAVCPTVAFARLNATCKAIASERNPAEVAEHVAAVAARKEQFQDEIEMLDFDNDEFDYFSR